MINDVYLAMGKTTCFGVAVRWTGWEGTTSNDNEEKCSFSGGKIVPYCLLYLHTHSWPSVAQSSLKLCTGRPPKYV